MSQLAIMQLSDLHRETSVFPSNKAFVSSIVSDISKYLNEEVPVPEPDILVICGDVVQGPNQNYDFETATQEIEHQYSEAADILNQLCAKLFSGDKDRIVITPGNHDVSWPHSRKSMQKLNKADHNIVELLKRPESNVRWNWEDFSFYQISDHHLYEQRLLPFAKFYTDFYNNQRKYSLIPEEQYDIFEFPEYKTLFAGFNSCFMNDHLNLTGRIHPESMASCYNYINQEKFDDWLKIAVWHHDMHGVPNRADFMDERAVQFLIDKGFQIGLHGHLHKDEIFEIKFSADQTVKIPVFGCGSLSASPQNIPLGASNQYSIIEIDASLTNLRYHVRKAVEQPPELPIWMPGNLRQNKDKSYIDVELERHVVKEYRMPAKSALLKGLVEVEDLIVKKEHLQALTRLKVLDQANPFVRRFTIECLWQLDKDDELADFIGEPKSVTEFAYLSESLWRKNRMKDLKELVDKLSSIREIADSEPYKRIAKKLADRGI
jgi:hypothetical protein